MKLSIPDMAPLPGISGTALWERFRLHWWSGSWFAMAEPWTNHPHRHHDYHELCLATHGRGTFRHGEQAHDLAPGVCFVSDLDVVHEIRCRRSRDLALAFFSFRLERIDPAPVRSFPDRVCERFLAAHRSAVPAPDLLGYLPLLCAVGGHGAVLRHRRTALAETWLLEALALLVEGPPEAFAAADEGGAEAAPSQVEAALRYIEQHLHRPLGVAEIAASIGLGERQLRRLFERHLGSTVVAALRERRLSAACRLLAMRVRVAEVAQRVGIASATGFSRQFRERYGCSPREWQRREAPREAVRLTSFEAGAGSA